MVHIQKFSLAHTLMSQISTSPQATASGKCMQCPERWSAAANDTATRQVDYNGDSINNSGMYDSEDLLHDTTTYPP